MESIIAAHAKVNIKYNNRDITADVAPVLQSFQYTDYSSDQVDDIQVTLLDPDDRWCKDLYPKQGATLEAEIVWIDGTSSKKLPCGKFVIDNPEYSSPGQITLKATSASITTSLRRQEKSREWKHITLRELAAQIARENGVNIGFIGPDTAPISKAHQKDVSDLAFLLQQCKRCGYALKVKNEKLLIVPHSTVDAAGVTDTLKRRDDIVESFSFSEDRLNTYSSCKVSYKHPDKGLISVTYKPDNAPQNGQVLTIREHVESEYEALQLAKARYEAANRGLITCDMTIKGGGSRQLALVSGVSLMLSGWGRFDGKYTVEEATHDVSGGYSVRIKLVKV